MSCLPMHGRVSCTACFTGVPIVFDQTKRTQGDWRITANPLAWGNTSPEVVVLGFSKGPTQMCALSNTPHDGIAYKGSRSNVGKILAHIGLLPIGPADQYGRAVDALIANKAGKFHFSSFIRCGVEQFDNKTNTWKGSGGGMLDKFVSSPFGDEVTTNCATNYLGALPKTTKLVIMFGLGSKLNYVDAAMGVYKKARPGTWKKINEVSYTDGIITVVHVEHFAAQGALIPDWLGVTYKERANYGRQARESVCVALGIDLASA